MKGKHSIGIRREPEGGEDRSKPGKRAVLEDAGKCDKTWRGVRDGLETGSDGDAAQSPVFLTERRDTLAHVRCRHYSPCTTYGRRHQVVKKTRRGKNRCRANNGHKSKCTCRDIQSIRITDKLTGITTFEPKIYESKPLCVPPHPPARYHRVYEVSTTKETLERSFHFVIGREAVT